MSARGQLAQAMIFSSWKGIPYVRQYVVPANPRTTDQTETRTVFAFLNSVFRSLGAFGVVPWNLLAQGRPFINRNAMLKSNLSGMLPDLTLANFNGSAGAHGGPSMQGFTADAGGAAGEVDWTITVGPLPTGWTVNRAGVIAIHDQDPHLVYNGDYREQSVANPGPYLGTIAGLTTLEDYMVSGWIEYQKPDGTTAVSPSGTIVVAAT
jgi:hypothetical protein